MTYYQFHTEDGEPYGSYEVFQVTSFPQDLGPTIFEWFWHPCFPGCIPDGEANGPFETEIEARKDADDWLPEEEQ
jgi:hypothetical protein